MNKRFSLISLALAAVLVAVVLAVALLARGSSGGSSAVPGESVTDLPVQLEREGVPQALDAAGASGATFVGEEPNGGDDVALPLSDLAGRKLVREATVSLEVDDVGAAVRRVESVAVAAGGFVSGSSVFVEETFESDGDNDGAPRRTEVATVTIRVPAEAYGSVMNQLRDIVGEVQSERSTTLDRSGEFADLGARLRNLEATEGTYLALLEKAETIADILTIQNLINDVRLEIELTQGSINLLDDLSDLATIVVQLSPPVVPVEAPSEAGWAQQAWDNAWEDSKEVLEAMGTAAIVIGVVLVWLAIPALVGLAAWRLFGPRRSRGGEAGGTATTV